MKATNYNLLKYSSLESVLLRELFFIEESPITLYQIEKSQINVKMKKHSFINNHRLKDLLLQNTSHLYALRNEKKEINDLIQGKLYQTSRSLSIGNPLEKTKKLISLMCLNQKYILEDVTNENHIKLQYQSAKNLCYFLLKNILIIEELYKHLVRQRFYFLYGHPILSSLFVLGLTKYSGQFTDKAIENLFIVSIFKDLGMSIVPTHSLNKEILEPFELFAFLNHAEHSYEIIKNVIPLTNKYLEIIKHHHFFSQLKHSSNVLNFPNRKRSIEKNNVSKQDDQVLLGTETILVCLSDMIAAMLTERPYRKSISLYETLKKIKPFIFEQYPLEFQLIIKYFNKNFILNK